MKNSSQNGGDEELNKLGKEREGIYLHNINSGLGIGGE
jgi:hypothetical protein